MTSRCQDMGCLLIFMDQSQMCVRLSYIIRDTRVRLAGTFDTPVRATGYALAGYT